MIFKRPKLSVVVIFYNMRREAPRTLFSLSAEYQQVSFPYEVIAIDNGSSVPLSKAEVKRFGRQFQYISYPTSSVSPVSAVNYGVRRAKSPYVMLLIDGARICSPGILGWMRFCTERFTNPFIYTPGFHLGDEIQNDSMLKGYDQNTEDRLLHDIDWRSDGYRLFKISCLALSSRGGYFGTIAESSCLTIGRNRFFYMGGFNEAFQRPAGGLATHDFFQRAVLDDALTPVCLLGEGTFHQFHGGFATNVPMGQHPWELYQEEYETIYGKPYEAHESVDPVFVGHMHPAARRFLLREE